MWEASFSELSAVADRQLGLITSAQADRTGIDRAALDHFKGARLLLELDVDVFQVAGSAVSLKYAYPYAVWLSIMPRMYGWERAENPTFDAVLSHESAGNLHGIGSLPASPTVFTTPLGVAAPRAARIHVARLAPDEVMIANGVPVTTPHRTIVDLVRDWTGHEQVGRAIFDAVRRDLVDLAELYTDLVPLAAAHRFPAKGREFLAYFVPELPPESLPPRNLKAYTALATPERVRTLADQVRPVVSAARAASGLPDPGERPLDDDVLCGDIAAEILGRIGGTRAVAAEPVSADPPATPA